MHWLKPQKKMFSVNGFSFKFGGTENTHMVNCHSCAGLWMLELHTVKDILMKENNLKNRMFVSEALKSSKFQE